MPSVLAGASSVVGASSVAGASSEVAASSPNSVPWTVAWPVAAPCTPCFVAGTVAASTLRAFKSIQHGPIQTHVDQHGELYLDLHVLCLYRSHLLCCVCIDVYKERPYTPCSAVACKRHDVPDLTVVDERSDVKGSK